MSSFETVQTSDETKRDCGCGLRFAGYFCNNSLNHEESFPKFPGTTKRDHVAAMKVTPVQVMPVVHCAVC